MATYIFSNMQLRHKVILLAVAPLILGAGILAFIIKHEGAALADRQAAEAKNTLLEAKRTELRHLMAVAQKAISDLQNSASIDPAKAKEALTRLNNLSFGEDGYFFVYTLDGLCVMHPRKHCQSGENMLNFTDNTNLPVIQESIEVATSNPDGGFLMYHWQQPTRSYFSSSFELPASTSRWSPKLGFFISVPRWHWMIGTGIYLDDIEETEANILASSSTAISRTMISIGVVATLAVLAVGGLGVALNLGQYRFANAKLQELTREIINTQEAARASMSRHLHDEVVQDLVAVNYTLEAALLELSSTPERLPERLAQSRTSLTAGIEGIRTLSRDLRPPLQGDGLPMHLEQVAETFSKRTGIAATVDVTSARNCLSVDEATAFLRVAEQSLDNIRRHANATRAAIQISTCQHRGIPVVRLAVRDNGCGFNVAAIESRRYSGIGLLNMRERIEALGGKFAIRSSALGTEIEAYFQRKPCEQDSSHDNTTQLM